MEAEKSARITISFYYFTTVTYTHKPTYNYKIINNVDIIKHMFMLAKNENIYQNEYNIFLLCTVPLVWVEDYICRCNNHCCLWQCHIHISWSIDNLV